MSPDPPQTPRLPVLPSALKPKPHVKIVQSGGHYWWYLMPPYALPCGHPLGSGIGIQEALRRCRAYLRSQWFI